MTAREVGPIEHLRAIKSVALYYKLPTVIAECERLEADAFRASNTPYDWDVFRSNVEALDAQFTSRGLPSPGNLPSSGDGTVSGAVMNAVASGDYVDAAKKFADGAATAASDAAEKLAIGTGVVVALVVGFLVYQLVKGE